MPITDIHAKEAKLVGLLPEPIQLWTVYAAAIPISSADPAAARAFVAALTGAGDARSLDQGRLAAAEIERAHRAGSSCSLSSSLRAASGVIGSPNT